MKIYMELVDFVLLDTHRIFPDSTDQVEFGIEHRICSSVSTDWVAELCIRVHVE